jgi:hypothetical protein
VKTISRPRLALLAGAVVLAGAALWWMNRAPSAEEMLAWLPEGEGPTVYIDFALLRRTGLLDRLAGDAAVAEEDYKAFIGSTGFDFRRDLDAALVRFRPDATLFVLAGRFDPRGWSATPWRRAGAARTASVRWRRRRRAAGFRSSNWGATRWRWPRRPIRWRRR